MHRLEEQAQCILVIIICGSAGRARRKWSASPDGMRRELTIVGVSAARFEASRLTTAPQICGRRWRARFRKVRLEVWPTTREQRAGAQDRQHPEQDAEEPAHQGQARAAGDLEWPRPKKDAVAALEAFVETYQINTKERADLA